MRALTYSITKTQGKTPFKDNEQKKADKGKWNLTYYST